ncbi:DUF4145 domain-containing protein [Rhodococcus sp. AG1013]|uniref:DUF4145 domain-containing protein n=1 Tax=Rhodococcus sp. AG1013 TaxID=2183996 RepID=UPI0015F062DE|nr:DUF4145 domain-containing protein [Rhodococcus sp. AG1013]
MGIHDDMRVVSTGRQSIDKSGDDGWRVADCADCGPKSQMAVLAIAENDGFPIQWMRCVNCKRGYVANGHRVSPFAEPLSVPNGLPDDVRLVWREARRCLGVGANAAAVMMCRKLLFHVAVSHGLPERNSKDRAPSFYEALEHLQAEGIITQPMRKWVDRIKDVGNQQNHEIVTIAKEDALDIARFTEKLLELAFEMDYLFSEGASRTGVS